MEDYNVEYKLDIPEKQNKLKAEIVAFLNSEGGNICLGVNDDGTINESITSSKKQKWEQMISNWIVNGFTPNVAHLIYVYPNEVPFRIKVLEGDDKPYFIKEGEGFNSKGVYIRVGSTKRVASFEEIQRMILQKKSHEFESISIGETKLTFTYIEQKFKEKGIQFDPYALSLIGKDGTYNNAALLLSDQNSSISKFAVFQGLDVRVFLDKKEFKGSLVKQIDEILYFANLSNRKKITISGKPERNEYMDIPSGALREAIVNCYCHRDYTLSGDIKVEFYDDRVQIYSPGSIPDGLTLDNIKIGMVAKRNKIIVNVLDKIDMIENYASGVRRIFDDYEGFGKQPVYNISNNGVVVTLYNRNYTVLQSDTKNDTQNDTKNDTKNELTKKGVEKSVDAVKNKNKDIRIDTLLRLIEEDPTITDTILMNLLDVSKSTVRRDITFLKKLGKLEYKGSARSGYWIVKK